MSDKKLTGYCRKCGKSHVLNDSRRGLLCVACLYRNGGAIPDSEPFTRELQYFIAKPAGFKLRVAGEMSAQ